MSRELIIGFFAGLCTGVLIRARWVAQDDFWEGYTEGYAYALELFGLKEKQS